MATQPPNQGNLPLGTGQTASAGQTISPSTRTAGAVRPEHVVAIVRAEVGRMRAEIEKDLESRLSGINSRLDKLPSTATFISTIIGGLAIALSLLFALLSWSSDRVDTAWQRSATMAQTLDKLVVQGDQNQKALEELRRKPTQEENKTTK